MLIFLYPYICCVCSVLPEFQKLGDVDPYSIVLLSVPVLWLVVTGLYTPTIYLLLRQVLTRGKQQCDFALIEICCCNCFLIATSLALGCFGTRDVQKVINLQHKSM